MRGQRLPSEQVAGGGAGLGGHGFWGPFVASHVLTLLQAARQGLPCYIHRPGLIGSLPSLHGSIAKLLGEAWSSRCAGGHSVTGAAAEDVFFHFLADAQPSILSARFATTFTWEA